MSKTENHLEGEWSFFAFASFDGYSSFRLGGKTKECVYK